MVRLTGEGLIECEECSNEIKIYSENFEYSSASSERGMGPEVQHSFYDEITCEQCGNKISFYYSVLSIQWGRIIMKVMR